MLLFHLVGGLVALNACEFQLPFRVVVVFSYSISVMVVVSTFLVSLRSCFLRWLTR